MSPVKIIFEKNSMNGDRAIIALDYRSEEPRFRHWRPPTVSLVLVSTAVSMRAQFRSAYVQPCLVEIPLVGV